MFRKCIGILMLLCIFFSVGQSLATPTQRQDTTRRLYDRVMDEFKHRDYEAAMATLKGLLSTDNADVLFLYGASLLNLQQPADAMPYLKAAITRNSRHLPARAALGQALLQLGKNEDAVGLLESALAADQDGSIHFQLFRAYQLTNRPAEAQQALAAYQRLRASLAGTP